MKFLFLLGPLILAALYGALLPLHIQGGDTAELVTAGFHRLVPHPPGYPLFLWLQHAWTHVFQVSTVFWRASFLSSVFGLLALSFMIFPLRKSYLFLIPCLLLGLNQEFLESAVLPDVFSLHALMVSVFGFVYLFVKDSKRYFLVPFLFMLSAANHHTTIFLIPCLGICFWEGMKEKQLKNLVLGSVVGGVMTVGLYLSLFLCRPENVLSWGNLTGFGALVTHILRVDYGTFQLSSTKSGGDLDAFAFFLKTLIPFVPLLIFAVVRIVKQGGFDLKLIGWAGAIVCTLIFPMAMNVSPEMMGAEVLKRFHVMPLVLIMFLFVYALTMFEVTKKNLGLFILMLVPVLTVNISHLPSNFGLRHDSVIEDYSRTMYQEALKHQPVIVLADNDSSYFGIRYIQALEGQESDKVFVMTAPLLFNKWYSPKISKVLPEFVLPAYEKIVNQRELNVAQDLVQPNLDKINFITNKDYKTGEGYKVTFMKLGRLVEKGSGIHFDPEETVKLTPPAFIGPQAYTKGYLFYQYSHYYFARGHFILAGGDAAKADEYWRKAIEVVPYAFPAAIILCKESPKEFSFCSDEELGEMQRKTKGFF